MPLCLLFFLIASEVIYFLIIIGGGAPINKADLVVVFEGSEGRVQTAYHLVDLAYAPALLISPADNETLDTYDRMYKPLKRFDRVLENNARTTFENALFTSEIIKERGCKSVILITSWDHMPRSYLLMRMITGTDIQISTCSVKRGRIGKTTWYKKSLGWKMIYNEMLETWGSLIEFANYQIKGSVPTSRIGQNNVFGGIKQLLLFDLNMEDV